MCVPEQLAVSELSEQKSVIGKFQSEVHGQGSLLRHLKVPTAAPRPAHVHVVPSVIVLVLLVLFHHPVLPAQPPVSQEAVVVAVGAARLHAGPALLAQAAVELAHGREDGLELAPEGRQLHGAPAEGVRALGGLGGVEGRLGAAVVLVDAAGAGGGPSESLQGLELLGQLPQVTGHLLKIVYISFDWS